MEFFGKKTSPKVSALLVVILLIVALAIVRTGGYHGRAKQNTDSKTRIMFDTIVKIEIEGSPYFDLSKIYSIVWSELAAWESELDLYDTLSALYHANLCDSATVLPPRLASTVRKGLDSIVPTGGNFDIRIGEITTLWDFAGEGRVPSNRELVDGIDKMHRPIRLLGDTLFKLETSPRLDLGGIAKGMVLDAVFAILDTIPEIQRFIIDLGGNIRVKSSNMEPFQIGVQSPRGKDFLAGKFELASGEACATAGDYQRFFFADGVKYHHILDPTNGLPAFKCSAVTVIADNGTTADIMSTALFVMGPKQGMAFLELNGHLRAVFLDSMGTIIAGNLQLTPISGGDRS